MLDISKLQIKRELTDAQRAMFSLHVSSIIKEDSAQHPNELCLYLRILHPTIYVQSQRSVSVQEVCRLRSVEDCKGSTL